MYDIIFTRFLRYSDIVKKIWYHTWYHIAIMISYMISYLFFNIIVIYPFLALSSCHIKYDIIYISHRISSDISITWYWAWFWPWFGPLISVLRDIIAIWCHIFDDIIAYIMAPARRDGAGWGRHAPGAPPPPASPSPTCWGRVFSWTVTALIPRMDLLQKLLRE